MDGLLVRGEVALGVEGGGAAGARGGDRLAVGVVDEVAGREDSRHRRAGAGRVDQHIALIVERNLALDELGARVVTDGDEQAGDGQFAGHPGGGVLEDDPGDLRVAQDIAVVGGGDSALEEATFLTRFAKSVTLIHRRDSLRASKIMQERAFNNDKIHFAWNSEVVDVLGDAKVSGVVLKDTMTGITRELPVTGLFIAIGHDPRSELVKGKVSLDDEGYVLVDAPSTRTSVPGVFAAGDLVDHTYRQAITAAGSGCAAALDAERWLAHAGS